MKIKIRLLITACLLFLFVINSYADKLPAPFKILPQPQSVILLNKSGVAFGSLQQLFIKGDFKIPAMGVLLSQLTIAKKEGKGTVTYSHRNYMKA